MKYILILILIGAVMLTACTTDKPIACTEDAKVCDDGTAVGRDPNNNCEFFECGNETPIPTDIGGGIGDGKTYVSEDPEQCMLIKFMCEEGKQPFFNDQGCGCEIAEPICGNGICEAGEATQCPACYDENPPCLAPCVLGSCEQDCETPGKLQAIDCTDPRPVACTKEYTPVCAQVQVECITTPCDLVKETYDNPCIACANGHTISYTEGACENNAAGGTVLAGTTEEQCMNMDGTWTGYDCTGITENQCQEIGGTFNECASACRNDPEAEMCTLQCVQVCEFN